jgi:hypothetical protein
MHMYMYRRTNLLRVTSICGNAEILRWLGIRSYSVCGLCPQRCGYMRGRKGRLLRGKHMANFILCCRYMWGNLSTGITKLTKFGLERARLLSVSESGDWLNRELNYGRKDQRLRDPCVFFCSPNLEVNDHRGIEC